MGILQSDISAKPNRCVAIATKRQQIARACVALVAMGLVAEQAAPEVPLTDRALDGVTAGMFHSSLDAQLSLGDRSNAISITINQPTSVFLWPPSSLPDTTADSTQETSRPSPSGPLPGFAGATQVSVSASSSGSGFSSSSASVSIGSGGVSGLGMASACCGDGASVATDATAGPDVEINTSPIMTAPDGTVSQTITLDPLTEARKSIPESRITSLQNVEAARQAIQSIRNLYASLSFSRSVSGS